MKEILTSPQFLARIDENGKEFEKPKIFYSEEVLKEFADDEETLYAMQFANQKVKEWNNATEVIKLPTLSEFVLYLHKKRPNAIELDNGGTMSEHADNDVCTYDYAKFLQQPLTKEMFIGEDAILVSLTFEDGEILELDEPTFESKEECLEFRLDNWYFELGKTTIENLLNREVTLYLNPDKI